MRRGRLLLLIATVVAMFGMIAPASAGGVNAQQKADQGWTCFPAGPATPQNIHCLNPNQGSGKAASALVFSGTDGSYLGTESLRFTDKDLSELPCPKDGGHWHNIGDDTWACHHWKGKPAG